LRMEDGVAAGPFRLRPAASGPRGPVVQTNPIGRSQSRKTKPILGGAGWAGPRRAWDAGENMPNEPNSRPRRTGRGSETGGDGAKQTQFAADRMPHYSTVLSFQYSSPTTIVPNEPNSRAGKAIAEPNRAKRSQFHQSAGAPEDEIRKTNPICSPGHRARGEGGVRLCQTKPNLGKLGYLGEGTWNPVVPNKANWAGRPGSPGQKCAKRTQICDRAGKAPGPPEGPVVQTNPICPTGPTTLGDPYNSLAVLGGCR